MYDNFHNLNLFRETTVNIPVVVIEDPNVNGFTLVEIGMLKVFPDEGVVVADDVVIVNVGKENDEWVKEGISEAVVSEEPDETPKVRVAFGGWEESTDGCSTKIKKFVEIVAIRNLYNLIKLKYVDCYRYDKRFEFTKDQNRNASKYPDTRTFSYCW